MSYQKKILVVEDNEINRTLLCEILSKDYQILEAENGQAALDILRRNKDTISLILLDVIMPVMDGYTFLDHIKGDAELSMIPVIVTTQGSSEEDELTALAHGATDFVPKPYRPKIILHRVAALIKLRETAAMVNQLQFDRLTGLYNKEFFYQKVQEELTANPDRQYRIIASNVENFKLVNDIFGRQKGDQLLKDIADMAQHMVGDSGFFGRIGVDRFVCFQRWEQGAPDGQYLSSAVLGKYPPLLDGVVMRFGLYEITDRTLPVEQMCDRALLAADSIKNQYNRFLAVYDDSLRKKLLREKAITSAMETALTEKQFSVYLQPKYGLHNSCMAGAEALVRWTHPEWGFMSPGEFIPLFERNGFIYKLDLYVWEAVCAQLRKWKDEGYPLLPISVNISRADVFQLDLVETIPGLTKKYGIDPAYLHLEITESAYTNNPDQIISIVDKLRQLGFVVEMDDFGSGYSSLNMLSQMTLDILKLDMKFIQNEIAKPAERSLLSDVIHMAHRAHLSVVAEGVETREQVHRLQSVGCDYVQGYFFAKPMPIPEYEQLLRAWKPQPDEAAPSDPSRDLRSCLLVVDENADYRKVVERAFSGQYCVLEAGTAEEALSRIQKQNSCAISVAVLSMTLPDKGAEAVMKVLRQTPTLRETPVLATIPSGTCISAHSLALEADDFLCKCHPAFDLCRRVQRLLDMAALRQREYVLHDAATHDPLTGLLNRRGLQDAIDTLQLESLPLALCLFDVDNLKQINDTYGHDTGDRMLRFFAELLERETWPEDIKCRYGGDEFIVVLRGVADEEIALKKVESICQAFQGCCPREPYPTACSAGVLLCPSGDALSPERIDQADQALYRAKRENKGSCCLWQG